MRRRTISSPGWRGAPWSHPLLESGPVGEEGLLFITGDWRPRDDAMAAALASRCGLPTAVLAAVPNQPWNDLEEDALIAHSFLKFLETGDESWPLLGAMTAAVPAALDALGWRRAVIAGCSKRGWTAWLAALSGDPRIAGIASLGFEALDMPAQMALQRERFAGYSEKIEDYSTPGLADLADDSATGPLLDRVDPIRQIHKLNCPALVVVGTNDPYWPVDAHTVYWDRIPGTKLISAIPNGLHDLESHPEAWGSVGFFARCCLGAESDGWPKAPDPRCFRHERWEAGGEGPDLRESRWWPAPAQAAWRAALECRWLMGDEGPAMFTSTVSLGTPQAAEE